MWKACFPFVLRWFMAIFSRWASWPLVYRVILSASTSEVFKTLDDLIPGQGIQDILSMIFCVSSGSLLGMMAVYESSGICVSGYTSRAWKLFSLYVCAVQISVVLRGWMATASHLPGRSVERRELLFLHIFSVPQAPSMLGAPGALWKLVTCYYLSELILISVTASMPIVELFFQAPSLFLCWAYF